MTPGDLIRFHTWATVAEVGEKLAMLAGWLHKRLWRITYHAASKGMRIQSAAHRSD